MDRKNLAGAADEPTNKSRLSTPECLNWFWLGWQDLNLRMRESKSRALPLGDTPMQAHSLFKIWGGRQVSNLLPPEPQSGALPIELRPPYKISGAPGEIRTPDTRLRRPLLYPTELQARNAKNCAAAGLKSFGAGDGNRTHATSLEG